MEDSQQGVVNPAAGYLNAEARRTLDSASYVANRVVSVPLPRDTVVKRMELDFVAVTDVTYAAGSPVASEFGAFQSFCEQIEVIVNGNRVVKSVKPDMLRLHATLFNGGTPRRAYSTTAAATAPTTLRAGREWLAGGVIYPATTGYFLFNEVARLSFELPFGYDKGKYDTELDLRDVSSAELKFYFTASTNLNQSGNAATVTYGNQNISVSPMIVENRARPRPQPGQVMFDYVEYTNSKTTSGQSKGVQMELQTGNYLCALGIMARNGDASKSKSEMMLSNLTLRVNGSSAIQGPMSHKLLQDGNMIRYGCDDHLGFGELASTFGSEVGEHPLKGFALMNLIRNGDWNTGINTSRAALVDTLKLEYDTPSITQTYDPATYTNSIEVIAHTHEVRPFIYSK